jgi:hypothetical protein
MSTVRSIAIASGHTRFRHKNVGLRAEFAGGPGDGRDAVCYGHLRELDGRDRKRGSL